MNSNKIRQKFISFFIKNKKFSHTLVDSSSLWPQDDPSVLLTTAGMQQFKPYLMGIKDAQKQFGNTKLVSIQRSFRTSDIEEVGDPYHNTFFEMLGNFSIGNYFKEEAIYLSWTFLTKIIKINPHQLWATYYSGSSEIAKDTEAFKFWQKYLPTERIIGFGKDDNWWGPPGKSGPCGPCSELHYDFTGKPCLRGKQCLPNCECGRFMELWNLVFMEFHMDARGKIKELPGKNIDTGMGLERLALILQGKKSIFETDLFSPLIKLILDDPNFGSTNLIEDAIRCRIAADHFKASVFLLSDGINFSNKEQGYILRRVFRRALDQYLHPRFNLTLIVDTVASIYEKQYPMIKRERNSLAEKMNKELSGYQKILNLNVHEIADKIIHLKTQTKHDVSTGPSTRKLTAEEAFILYSTYGISEERLKREGFTFDSEGFHREIMKHQKLSRAGAENKFGGHGLNSKELSDSDRTLMTRYHTATHLLHQALRTVLGPHVRQQGSDINPERLRFDFEHHSKLTEDEKNKIERLVNEIIKKNYMVTSEEVPYDDAVKSGALSFFKEKYPEKVTVYSIGDFSKELCGGPHVKNTSELGNFHIQSEKSSSSGIRRIKAILS
ncbi:MAG: alanine--tRNA ligase [Patescibacteria group bacterium]